MTTKVSSKGQVVLPKQVRSRLGLRPGTRLSCRIRGDSIVLTPEDPVAGKSRQVRDARTGLLITKAPPQVEITSDGVRAALLDFP